MAGPLLSIQDVNELTSLLSDNKALVVLPSSSGNVGQGTLQLGVVDLATYSTFITTAVAARVTSLETSPLPSHFPAPITLTMTGPVTGFVSFDGTSNQSWTSAIANGALSMAMVNGLVSELNTFTSEITTLQTTSATMGGLQNTWTLGTGMPSAADANTPAAAWVNQNTSTVNTPYNGYGALWTFNTSGTSPTLTPVNGAWIRQLNFDTNGGLWTRQNINLGGWTPWGQFLITGLPLTNGSGISWAGGAYLNTGAGGGTITIGPGGASSNIFNLNNSAGVGVAFVNSAGNWSITGSVTVSGLTVNGSVAGSAVSMAASNSTLVQRNASGFIFSNYINTTANDIGAGPAGSVAVQTGGDGYHRWQTLGNFFSHAPFTYANAGIQSTGLTTATNGQGAYMGWNRNTTSYIGNLNGETDFINHKGGGNGGFGFYNTDGTTYTQLFAIDYNGNIYTTGVAAVGRVICGYDSGSAGSVNSSDWFRTSGAGGWYSATYGGGIYMTDGTYVRAYNGKAMAASDFVIVSDAREKAGIRPLEFKGRLSPKSFTMKSDGSKDFGFIAQDVMENYPEAVGYIEDSDRYQLSYGKLTAILSHQINALEDEVALLRGRLDVAASSSFFKALRNAVARFLSRVLSHD